MKGELEGNLAYCPLECMECGAVPQSFIVVMNIVITTPHKVFGCAIFQVAISHLILCTGVIERKECLVTTVYTYT